MKIFVVGLGLMGASFAEAFTSKGHIVFGYDKDQTIIDEAIKNKVILDGKLDLINDSDIVMLCLYPKDNIEFIKQNKNGELRSRLQCFWY